MKKLFGLFMISGALLLASCGGGVDEAAAEQARLDSIAQVEAAAVEQARLDSIANAEAAAKAKTTTKKTTTTKTTTATKTETAPAPAAPVEAQSPEVKKQRR